MRSRLFFIYQLLGGLFNRLAIRLVFFTKHQGKIKLVVSIIRYNKNQDPQTVIKCLSAISKLDKLCEIL